MKANNILNRILAELSSIREVKFEQMTLENGAVLEAESFEAGNEVFVISGEDRVAAPIGEHLLADGRILVITEEGVIAEEDLQLFRFVDSVEDAWEVIRAFYAL